MEETWTKSDQFKKRGFNLRDESTKQQSSTTLKLLGDKEETCSLFYIYQ